MLKNKYVVFFILKWKIYFRRWGLYKQRGRFCFMKVNAMRGIAWHVNDFTEGATTSHYYRFVPRFIWYEGKETNISWMVISSALTFEDKE